MADKLVGGDGDAQQVITEHFWMLTDVPDRFVATAIMAIEHRYNPERDEADIRWFAPAEEGQ